MVYGKSNCINFFIIYFHKKRIKKRKEKEQKKKRKRNKQNLCNI